MAADTATYVVNRIGGKGGVVMFVFDAFPPVQVRGVIADAIFKNNPDIKIIDRVTPDVQDGGIADSRAKMEAILAAHPAEGLDRRGLGGLGSAGARRACRRSKRRARGDEGIVITGMDANPQAREAIAKGGDFEASMAQDFKGIGRTVAETVARYLAGEKIKQSVIYVPTKLITERERQAVRPSRSAADAVERERVDHELCSPSPSAQGVRRRGRASRTPRST